MSEHLPTDSLVAVGSALEWEIDTGLRHLQTCDECRDELESLRLTRASLVAEEAVDPAMLRRIQDSLIAAAAGERARAVVRHRVLQVGEGLLAGVTALIVVLSSHIDIDTVGSAVIGITLGAAMMVAGTKLARTMPVLRRDDRHA